VVDGAVGTLSTTARDDSPWFGRLVAASPIGWVGVQGEYANGVDTVGDLADPELEGVAAERGVVDLVGLGSSRPSEKSSRRIAPGFSARARSRNERVPGVLGAFGDNALGEKTKRGGVTTSPMAC